jgi:Arc/MetJ-type ribon-helix-helix transcriptional regulator
MYSSRSEVIRAAIRRLLHSYEVDEDVGEMAFDELMIPEQNTRDLSYS